MSCTLCDVTETERYEGTRIVLKPYRCSDCGECYACSHGQVGYRYWICPGGRRKRVSKDPGVVVSMDREAQ